MKTELVEQFCLFSISLPPSPVLADIKVTIAQKQFQVSLAVLENGGLFLWFADPKTTGVEFKLQTTESLTFCQSNVWWLAIGTKISYLIFQHLDKRTAFLQRLFDTLSEQNFSPAAYYYCLTLTLLRLFRIQQKEFSEIFKSRLQAFSQ